MWQLIPVCSPPNIGAANPCSVAHTALPRDFSDLLSPTAVDELIAERGVRAPFIRMAKTGDVLARSCYTGPAGFGAEMPDQVDSAKVLAEFAAGATIVLQGLHRLWPPLIDFVRGLTDDLGHPVQANAYITPPDAQGFEPHYDVHDVFVLQAAGEKRWTVHEPVHQHPLDSQPWTEHRDAITARIRDAPIIDTVLSAGDALYLPRGWVHSARSLDTASIHMTIGVSALTYLDVVRAVVDTLAADEEFRKSLPMGIDATDRSEMASTTSKVMAQLADAVRDRAADLSDRAATQLSDRHAERTRPVAVRPLATLDAMDAAGALRVRWRHGLIGTLEHLGEQVSPAAAGSDHHVSRLVRHCGRGAATRTRRGRRNTAGPRPRRRRSAHSPAVARGRRGSGPGWYSLRMSPKRTPCSDQSLARNDPIYGTAGAGQVVGDARIVRRLGAIGIPRLSLPHRPRTRTQHLPPHRSERLRVTAIRRPGRRDETPRWRWFIAHCEEGSEALYGGEVDDARGYLDIALDGSDGERVDGPLVAVCAHGKHDQCCAVRGRSAASAIAAEYPEFTWECSHLGGDRFAATMLILPEGLCYGRVDSTDSAGLVAKYLDGRLDHRYLRGRTCLPHPVQAAQYFARESLGEDRIDALSPLKVEHAEHQIRVELRTDSGSVNVVLAEKMSEPLLSMCRASVPGAVRTFELVSISSD